MEWEFGEGLSYVSVSVSAPRVSTASLDEKGSVTVTVDVTNHGVLAPGYKHGDEPALYSVLLFLFDLYRRVTPEYKLLKRCVSWSCRCDSLTLTLCVTSCSGSRSSRWQMERRRRSALLSLQMISVTSDCTAGTQYCDVVRRP